MTPSLTKVIFDYPNKIIMRHALDVYDWYNLSETQKSDEALNILRYINDLETLGNGE